MKLIRIRSIHKGEISPWIYIDEKEREQNPSTPAPIMKANEFNIQASKSRTNQFGRFRYSEKQYGILEDSSSSTMEISKVPIRIRTQNGEFIYTQQTSINGDWPAIRIRNSFNNENGPWVYLQYKEV